MGLIFGKRKWRHVHPNEKTSNVVSLFPGEMFRNAAVGSGATVPVQDGPHGEHIPGKSSTPCDGLPFS